MRLYKVGFSIVVGSACLLAAATASAQDKNTQFGFQIERFEPTLAGESTFGVERPWYSAERWFAADITLDAGHDQAWIGVNRGGGDTAIDNQLVGRLNLAASFLDRATIGIALPMTLYESGRNINGAEPLGPNGSVGFGDPRISGMVRLFGHSDRSPISMHVGADLWIPRVGNANQLGHDGDAGVRFMPKLVLAGRLSWWFRWAFNIGYYWRDDAKYTSLPADVANIVGDEVRAGAEFAYTTPDNRFNFGPEIWVSSHALNGKFLNSEYTSVEIFATIHYLIADLFRVGFGVGGAPQQDIGTPQVRVLFRLAYAPVRKHPAPKVVVIDTDKDGIPDSEDACPTVPGVRTNDPKTNGCPPPAPPPDRDHDGVLDADDLCPDEPAGDHPDPKRPGCPAKDSDGDGVFDYEDQCPDTPAGAHPDPAKKGCPAIDSDGDGFFDYEDECPQVPAGAHPDPAHKGCPEPDRDHDTVPDSVDACPDVPGAPSPDPKKNGCPGLVEVRNGVIVIFQPVFFATNKDTILPKSYPVLNAVADAIKAEPEIKKIMIEGHTDNRGSASHNMDLSDRRAHSVMNYLIGKGLASDCLDAQGYGDSKPVASNKTAKGRAANRRVEFHIIDPAPGAPPPPGTPAPSGTATTPPPAKPQ
ncbi:MAG TPA: OmpA family protein [Polyangia bacterium]|nr:OmpA family protein [Polyangia bacterium]